MSVFPPLQHEGEYSSNYHLRTTSQEMNTCAGCCDTVLYGTRDACPKIEKRS